MRGFIKTQHQGWAESFVNTALHLSADFSFSTNTDEYDFVIIHDHGLSVKDTKRVIEKFKNHPVFLITDKGQYFKNVTAIMSHQCAIYEIIECINLVIAKHEGVLPKHDISSQERLILGKIKCGLSNKEIARLYDLPLSRVKYYIRQIYTKLNVKNRVEAALIADEIIV